MTIPPLDLTPCRGCGFSQSGIGLAGLDCLERHPLRFLKAVADLIAELDELRSVRREVTR